MSNSVVAEAPAAPRLLADQCCAPLLREPITADQAAGLARTLKALADPTRLRLVSMVAAHQ
ncbi:MAG TPA: transcriptional regulator, partial [Streptosporangiaceae bacterium]|nr:transcriptional regulator [Streptosporangiaceae bacterium]